MDIRFSGFRKTSSKFYESNTSIQPGRLSLLYFTPERSHPSGTISYGLIRVSSSSTDRGCRRFCNHPDHVRPCCPAYAIDEGRFWFEIEIDLDVSTALESKTSLKIRANENFLANESTLA
jgi:hypothetical protein